MITLIAAVGKNNEIGLDNQLLWKISEDMRHFKEYTMGKTIVMGRKTFESIGSKPLPGRKCVVVTSRDLMGSLCIVVKTVNEAMSLSQYYPEIVVIGGQAIYEQTIEYATKLLVTHVDAEFNADTFFPKIDLSVWKVNSSVDSNNDQYNYKFVEYIRNESMGSVKRKAG